MALFPRGDIVEMASTATARFRGCAKNFDHGALTISPVRVVG